MKRTLADEGYQSRDNTFNSESRQNTYNDFASSLNYSSKAQGSQLDQSNLWQSILNDVAQRDDVRESHLLVLGDKGAGKRSLIQSLNKNLIRASNRFIDVEKMSSQFSGLDSMFLYVKDLSEKDALNSLVTSDENLPRMNVWALQDVEKSDLLKVVLKPEDLEYTCALIVLDFEQPWEIMNSLQKWMGALGDTILDIMKQLPLSK